MKKKMKKLSNVVIDFADRRFNPQVSDLCIRYILKDRSAYNLNPIYQRNFVWPVSMEQKLIKSLIIGVGINAIHLSKTSEETFNVVDGKQRLTTIFRFVDNEFSIAIKLEDGNDTSLFLNEIKKKSATSPICSNFVNQFYGAILKQNVYDGLTVREEGQLFGFINQQEPLSGNELRYCTHYEARIFLKKILDKYFKTINKYTSKKTLENNKEDGTRFVHEILLLLFGLNLNENESDIRNIGRTELNCSVEKIEYDLIHNGEEYQLLSQESVAKLKTITHWVEKILTSNINPIKQKQNCVIDIFVILMRNYDNLNTNFILTNRNNFARAIVEFMDVYRKDKMGQGTKKTGSLKDRYEVLQSIAIKHGLGDVITNPAQIPKENKVEELIPVLA